MLPICRCGAGIELVNVGASMCVFDDLQAKRFYWTFKAKHEINLYRFSYRALTFLRLDQKTWVPPTGATAEKA
jgi:hypothetical protein